MIMTGLQIAACEQIIQTENHTFVHAARGLQRRKGINHVTKEPCVFKAKPASKILRVLPTKKLKEAINWN